MTLGSGFGRRFLLRCLSRFFIFGSTKPGNQHVFPPGFINIRARINTEERDVLSRDSLPHQVRLKLRPIDDFLRGVSA